MNTKIRQALTAGVAVLLTAGLSACTPFWSHSEQNSNSTNSGHVTSAVPATGQSPSSYSAQAKQIVLTTGDLPDGWKVATGDDVDKGEGTKLSDKFATCRNVTLPKNSEHIANQNFTKGDSDSITVSTTVFKSEELRRTIADSVTDSSTFQCDGDVIAHAMQDIIAAKGTTADVYANVSTLADVASDHSFGIRVTTDIYAADEHFTYYFDLIGVTRGPIATAVLVSAMDTPASSDLEQSVVEKLYTRSGVAA